MNLKQIQKPIFNEMNGFRSMLRSSISSDNILIDKVVNYILKRKGKQIRPLFVFLSAGLSGTISNSTYRAAILIEILHTATLIHDDVVDESEIRRGKKSIHNKWDNAHGVLVGDFVYSKAFQLMASLSDKKLIQTLSLIHI